MCFFASFKLRYIGNKQSKIILEKAYDIMSGILGAAVFSDKGDYSDKTEFFFNTEEGTSAITAALSPPLSVAPGENTSFQCEFHLGEEDKGVYDGVTVGIWERGGIYLTLLTLTRNEIIIINPKLDQEVPEYQGRVHAKALSNKTSNTSVMSVEIKDVRESDRRSFGCSMYFGPYRGLLGASVQIDVKRMCYLVDMDNYFSS